MQSLTISLNESEINEVSDKMLSIIPQIYQDSAEDIANHLLKSFHKQLPNVIRENVGERKNI
ncbi:MAG: hypothetical protein HC846_10375 [Blastocatellia bacterium]|nr:hypothetical protein [Blastocatellia bacterium]